MGLVRVPPEQWSRGRRWKNGAIVVATRIALALAHLAPRGALLAVGRGLGWLAWAFAVEARRLARRNVDRVFGARGAENARLVRRCFLELGALLGDAVTLLRPSTRALDALPMLPASRRVLDDARTAGRGGVLVTAHFGAWERMAGALVEAGYPLTT